MTHNQPQYLVLHPADNVAVLLADFHSGQQLDGSMIRAQMDIPSGHKIALRKIDQGSHIVKYGQVIGQASRTLQPGEHVHVDELRVSNRLQHYQPARSAEPTQLIPQASRRTFSGFVRPNGSVGTRNYLGVISTVSCSADVSQFIAEAITEQLLPDFPSVDGVVAVTHGAGCCHAPGSEGLEILQRTLAGYARNPNFGGIILVGLGCETNLLSTFMQTRALEESDLLRSLSIQNAGGTTPTVAAGVAAAEKMLRIMGGHKRETASAEHLTVALECGGSDAYSGITANPALGNAVDLLVSNGGTAILSETPEIYGAEHMLVERAETKDVADLLIDRIEWWEDYTARHDAQVNNNPTPGNKAGGISTILEKSMGAVAKGGSTNLVNVFGYGEEVQGPGLVFMDTPGYDVVSITGMIAGGANLVCFTTGRGTVAGFRPIPTMKLASNSAMFDHLQGDMDINCGRVLDGACDLPAMGAEIFEQMLATASGQQTKSERLGFGGSEFVPWHMGAIL